MTETETEPSQGRASAASVSVIIPTYNERENIGAALNRCSAVLEATEYEYELIIVDDDSPDGTWKFVEETYRDDDHVHVLRRTEHKGLALSIMAGFHAASMDSLVVIDSDLQHPPEKISELLAALETGADVAIGSRYTQGGEIQNWSRFRRVVSKGATGLAKLAIPTARGVSDPMSGLFAVRRSVISGVQLEPQGYKILLEILSRCEIDQIVEVPYTFHERTAGESKLTPVQYRQFTEHVMQLAIVRWASAAVANPQRIVRLIEFLGVGTIGVGVNMLVFLTALDTGAHYLLAGIVAFLVAVQWNFVGNWLVTFDQPRDALLQRYASFHAVCIVGFVIYEAALALLASILPIVVANLGAITVSSLWNFIGSDNVAFAPLSETGSQTAKRPTEKVESTTTNDFRGADDS